MTTLLTPEDRLSIFFHHFICRAEYMLANGANPCSSDWWLKASNGTFVSRGLRGFSFNPCSLILNGRKLSRSIYGSSPDAHNRYMSGHYPYFQLEQMYCLPSRALTNAFYEGFSTRKHDDWEHTSGLHPVAFDIGRYLANRYMGTEFTFDKNRPIFDAFKNHVKL